jgi:hypothetical protein
MNSWLIANVGVRRWRSAGDIRKGGEGEGMFSGFDRGGFVVL